MAIEPRSAVLCASPAQDIVVFSTVRANPRGAVGFLDDWRRLNVAITRPRRALLLVGHAATLQAGDPTWARYVAWLRERGLVVPWAHLAPMLAA